MQTSNKTQKIAINGFKGFKFDAKKKKLYCSPLGQPFYYPLKRKIKVDGVIAPCVRGLHFCESIRDLHFYCVLSYCVFIGRVKTTSEVIRRSDTDYHRTYEKSVTGEIIVTELIPTREIAKYWGYKANGGAKIIKNCNHFDSDLLFNTPELLLKANSKKSFKAKVIYLKSNGLSCSGSRKLVMEIL